jgi:magnesium chelatase subunit I
MASMASSLAGTPIAAAWPRATSGKSRRAMRCNASAATDAEQASKELGFPFVKIVGQNELKLALTLNVIVRTPPRLASPANRARRPARRATRAPPPPGSSFVIFLAPTPLLGADDARPPAPAPTGTSPLAPAAVLSHPPASSFFRAHHQDSKIGGCLIMGDRGTGKSVAVRALQDLLPEIPVVKNDAFNSSPTDPQLMGPDALERYKAGEALEATTMRVPMVEVPLGTTEDRICGTIDIERALAEGVKAYDAGLLARANRGLLYIDEVNLLDDSLVDVVLDSAAGGWNTVEREGISITHPAKFIMIGSGNPEEGELRPQLLDRFGMACNISTIFDKEQRIELVQNRMAYEADAEAFVKSCEEETNELKAKIADAQKLLPSVTMERDLAVKISGVCALVDVDGLRGDIVVTRAAKALVAYEGRTEVTAEDIQRVIGPCLSHRLRKDPMDTMDGSFKVMLGFNKIFNGSAMKDFSAAMEEGIEDPEAKAKEEEEAAKPPPAKKAGAWGGLPGSR